MPAEIVFDQGLGDLFVIRNAGNIVPPPQIGRVEFAAARFDTRLARGPGHPQLRPTPPTLAGPPPPPPGRPGPGGSWARLDGQGRRGLR